MWTAVATYGLSVAASDLDNDGWPDIYVANDSAPATLYLNQKDGTFRDIAIEAGAALSAEAKPQAGMGVSIGDYEHTGNFDIVKTNFAGDTDSLYTNMGDANFEDHTYPSGLGENTRLLGWGVGFFDMLDSTTKVDTLEIRWLSGQVDHLANLDANRLYVIQEGGKILQSGPLIPAEAKA